MSLKEILAFLLWLVFVGILASVIPTSDADEPMSYCPSKENRNAYTPCNEVKHDVTI